MSKQSDADSEQYETCHWANVAHDCGYIRDDEREELLSMLASIGRMLHSMKNKAHLFCKGNFEIREEPQFAQYGNEDEFDPESN